MTTAGDDPPWSKTLKVAEKEEEVRRVVATVVQMLLLMLLLLLLQTMKKVEQQKKAIGIAADDVREGAGGLTPWFKQHFGGW